MSSSSIFALAAVLLVAGCATGEPERQSVRICDESGCQERPPDYAGGRTGTDSTPDEMKRRVAALRELAAEDAAAAHDLGLRYLRGDGVPQDSYRALQWLRRAGERGHRPAQTALGRLYLTGLQEMGADPQEAERWLRSAAEQGDEQAKELLPRAVEARQEQQAYYEWRERKRREWRAYWRRDAPYYWHWHDGRWREAPRY